MPGELQRQSRVLPRSPAHACGPLLPPALPSMLAPTLPGSGTHPSRGTGCPQLRQHPSTCLLASSAAALPAAWPAGFRTQFQGYAVRFSPFEDSKLAVATSQNYGIVGNGRQYVLQVLPGAQTPRLPPLTVTRRPRWSMPGRGHGRHPGPHPPAKLCGSLLGDGW